MPRRGVGCEPDARRVRRVLASAAAFFAVVGLRAAKASGEEAAQQTADWLLDLPLEELVKIKVTTASRHPQELEDVPVTTYVVTEEDFRAYGFRDLKDVLRNLPGIEYVWAYSHLFGGQRGFSSYWELTKLLINGRESNFLSTGAIFIGNQFSLTGVKRIEIVQGPASVLYGPEALSGVINIITKDAENSEPGSEARGVLGGGDKSSLDCSGAMSSVVRRGPLSLAMGAYIDGGRGPDMTNFLKTNDFSEGNRDLRTSLLENGNPYRNNTRNYRLNFDLSYSPMAGVKINAGALSWRMETGGGIEQPLIVFTNSELINEQTHFYAGGEYKPAAVPLKVSLSYHFMLENFWTRNQNSQDTGDNPPPLVAFNIENSKLNVANLQVDYFPSVLDNYLLAGVGTHDTQIGEPTFTGVSPTDTTPGQPVSLVGRYLYPPPGYFSNTRPFLHQNRIYLYAQDQQSLWNKRVQMTAGLRYDHNTVYGDILNVRSGLVLRPLANYTVRATFGQGFREPRVLELGLNPDLKPSRMNSWEVSALFSPVDNLSGQIAYFQNRASHLIVATCGPTSCVPTNTGAKRVAGIETLLRYRLGAVSGDLWHSYEYSLDEQPLFGASHKLGFGPRYNYRDHLSVAVRGKWTNGARGQGLDAAGNPIDITVRQYFTLDVNALARDLALAGAHWDVSFSILNILGKTNYYVNSPFSPPNRILALGREYFGQVALRF